MAHLLVIENWYSGIGHRFLRRIHELGHRFTFVSRDLRIGSPQLMFAVAAAITDSRFLLVFIFAILG